jgi:hypothetical protein
MDEPRQLRSRLTGIFWNSFEWIIIPKNKTKSQKEINWIARFSTRAKMQNSAAGQQENVRVVVRGKRGNYSAPAANRTVNLSSIHLHL